MASHNFSASRSYSICGALLLGLLTAAIYYPALSGEFIMDDEIYVADNQLAKQADGLYWFWLSTKPVDYFPVCNTSFWVQWRLWGMSTTGYHVVNLALHIINSLLIWKLLNRLAVPGAYLAALLFAVHPVNVESTAWIGQHKGLLAMLWMLLALLCFVRTIPLEPPQKIAFFRPGTGHWYALTLVCFLLSILSKPSTVVLPVLMLLLIGRRRTVSPWDLASTAPFFALAAILTRVHMWFQLHSSEIVILEETLLERLLNAGTVIWFYLSKAIAPWGLSFIYPRWRIDAAQLRWWVPLITSLCVTALLWRYRHRWARPLWLAWLWFCVSLLPVMGFAEIGFLRFSLVADHYQYTALIAVVALASAWWWGVVGGAVGVVRQAGLAATILVVAVLSMLTWLQAGLYQSREALYRAALDHNPDSYVLHDNLGVALADQGKLEEAIRHHHRAIELGPPHGRTHNNLGVSLRQVGDLEGAIEQYRLAIQYSPDYIKAKLNLGVALGKQGKVKEAVDQYEQILKQDPEFAEAHYNLANLLVKSKNDDEAQRHYRAALAIRPNYSEARHALAALLFRDSKAKQAIAELRELLRRAPNFFEGHMTLASVASKTNDPKTAAEHYRHALKLQGGNISALNDLAWLLCKTNDESVWSPREGVKLAERAVEISSGRVPELLHTMATAYKESGQRSKALDTLERAIPLARKAGKQELLILLEEELASWSLSEEQSPERPN